MSTGRTIVVLQARMGSTRLPGKAMRSIEDTPLIGHCLARLLDARVGPVVLATTMKRADDVLAEAGVRFGAEVFRGSNEDVLGRFVSVADAWDADLVVRATGDNPAVDPDSAVRLVRFARAHGVDHAVESSLPFGATVEVVRADALRRAGKAARASADREHVTTFIRRSPGEFRCAIVDPPAALRRADLRFTVDTAEDLSYMRRVFGEARARRQGTSLAALIAAADALTGHREVA